MIKMKIESKVNACDFVAGSTQLNRHESQELLSWDPPQPQDYEISLFDQFRYSIKCFLESWNFPSNLIQIITYLFEFLINFSI